MTFVAPSMCVLKLFSPASVRMMGMMGTLGVADERVVLSAARPSNTSADHIQETSRINK